MTAWRARWRNPQNRPRSKVFERKRDADAFAAEVESHKNRGTYVDPLLGRQPFEAFADEWAAGQDWKEGTRESWDYIRAHLGGMPLAQIDQLTLKATRAALAEDYARNTVKLTMAYAGMIMRGAVAAGRIGRDPTAGLRAPKVGAGDPDGKVRPDNVPTRPEALAILAAAPAPFRAAVALGLAGLRVGEVLGMTADRLELRTRTVRVDRQLQRIDGRLAFTGHLGDTVETVASTYAHWLRDDRHIPAEVLDRVMSPASPSRHSAGSEGTS